MPARSAAICAAKGVLFWHHETGAARRRPRQGASLSIGDRHDGVIERRMNVSKSVRYLALTFFEQPDLNYLLVPYFVSLFLLTYLDL